MYIKEKKSLDDIRHIIAIAAGKGGVGKSTVAVNTALLLKEQGHSVGLLDADLYGPSLRRMLPEEQLPRQHGERVAPALSAQGIKTISMGFMRQEGEAAVIRAPIANRLVTQYIEQVDWGKLDYLLIDFPPGTGDIQLTLSQEARLSGAVMVTTPQEVAVMDVKKAMHLFEQVQVPIIGVVENMSYYHHEATGERIALFGEGGGRHLAHTAGVPFLGELPVDPLVAQCGDAGLSLFRDERASIHLVDAYSAYVHRMAEHLALITAHRDDYMNHFELIWER